VLLLRVLLGLHPDRARRVLRADAVELPDWADGLSLANVHAFGATWTVRVKDGAATVERAGD
jgi:hypothetical protein